MMNRTARRTKTATSSFSVSNIIIFMAVPTVLSTAAVAGLVALVAG